MAQNLTGRRVAILVTDGFEQIELTSPREALQKTGAKTFVIAPKGGEVQGFKHHDKADKIAVDLTLDKADPNDFDAALLPGGVINADALRIDEKAQRFVREMDRAGKPVAVICHGAWLLVSADLVKDRTITSWPTLQDDLRNAGARWQDKECIRDRNWVSSRKPDDLPVFNEELIRLFSELHAGKAMRPENRDSLEVRA
jgi:protease I